MLQSIRPRASASVWTACTIRSQVPSMRPPAVKLIGRFPAPEPVRQIPCQRLGKTVFTRRRHTQRNEAGRRHSGAGYGAGMVCGTGTQEADSPGLRHPKPGPAPGSIPSLRSIMGPRGAPPAEPGATRVRPGLWWHPESRPGVWSVEAGPTDYVPVGPASRVPRLSARPLLPAANTRTAPHTLRSRRSRRAQRRTPALGCPGRADRVDSGSSPASSCSPPFSSRRTDGHARHGAGGARLHLKLAHHVAVPGE